jgi:hypothetical protein
MVGELQGLLSQAWHMLYVQVSFKMSVQFSQEQKLPPKVTCQNPSRNPSRKNPNYNQLSTSVGIVCVKQCSRSEEFLKYLSMLEVGGGRWEAR